MNNVTFKSLVSEFIKNHKKLLVLFILVLVIAPAQEIGIPHIIGKMLESVKNKRIDIRFIYILIGLIVLGQIAVSINDYIEATIFPLFQSFVSQKIIDYVFDKNKDNLQDIFTGKIIGVLISAPRSIFNYLDAWRSYLIPQLIVIIVASAYFFYHNFKLGLILTSVIVLYYITLYFTVFNCNSIAQNREKFMLNLNDEITDIFSNIVSILNMNKQEEEQDRIGASYKVFEMLSRSMLKCALKHKYVIIPLILVMVIIFVIYGYKLVLRGEVKLETFVVMLIIFLYILNSIMRSINLVKDSAIRWGIIKENLEIFNSLESANKPSSEPYKNADKYIVFDNVSFSYHEKLILNNANFTVNKGEKLLITGQIGKGKTTILKLLMKYHIPTNGHIYINNVPLDLIATEELRKHIGFIPQNPILFNRSLYKNIIYGSENKSKEEVYSLIKELKLEHIFDFARMDMKVGKMGSKLSGGQRQIVWILRTILQNPEILIMDEPTSSIDNDTKKIIEDLFTILMKDRTVIIVSHDLALEKYCDRTLTFN